MATVMVSAEGENLARRFFYKGQLSVVYSLAQFVESPYLAASAD